MVEFTNDDDLIDGRDIAERLEQLEDERSTLAEARGAAMANVGEAVRLGVSADSDAMMRLTTKQDDADAALAAWDESAEGVELMALRALVEELDSITDEWRHGETLIRASYFTDYIEEVIHDCYELPKEMTSGEWPWRHIKIDYEAAAEEAKVDYAEVDFSGVTYFIRSV